MLNAEDHAASAPSGHIRVLPSVDSGLYSGYFACLRDEDELHLLPNASLSSLADRVRRDRPDVIAIVARKISAPAHDVSLGEALSTRPAILFTEEAYPVARRRAAELHIRSVLPIDVTRRQLLAALRAVAADLVVALEPVPDRADAGHDWENEMPREETLVEHLTARETTVLRLMAHGRGNKEIALQLTISEHTVKFYVSSILAKLGAASRTEAVTIGILHGLVAI